MKRNGAISPRRMVIYRTMKATDRNGKGGHMVLNKWIDNLKGQFDCRDLNFRQVHKARLCLQLRDGETEEIILHDIEFIAKNAPNLKIKS